MDKNNLRNINDYIDEEYNYDSFDESMDLMISSIICALQDKSSIYLIHNDANVAELITDLYNALYKLTNTCGGDQ